MKRNISLPSCAFALFALVAPCHSLGECLPSPAASVSSSAAEAGSAQTPQFYDEAHFTIAGVADPTNLGGHGSDTVVRTRETLARDTASLGQQKVSASAADSTVDEKSLHENRERLHAELVNSPNSASLHHALADIAEKLKYPLEAVHEYQQAASLNASEDYLFDWGTELLAHRAYDAAAEVFTKGNRLFPNSVRMLIGLAVALHAGTSDERAFDCLYRASDLNPLDTRPYLFLAKMQDRAAIPSDATLSKLARFATLHPENALANYYYAANLWNRAQSTPDVATREKVQTLLDTALRDDPQLGAAYVMMGIVNSAAGNLPKAIVTFQRASQVGPELEEPHYRLAQLYRREGDKTKAQQELSIYRDLARKALAKAERDRLQIPQFVVELRRSKAASTFEPGSPAQP